MRVMSICLLDAQAGFPCSVFLALWFGGADFAVDVCLTNIRTQKGRLVILFAPNKQVTNLKVNPPSLSPRLRSLCGCRIGSPLRSERFPEVSKWGTLKNGCTQNAKTGSEPPRTHPSGKPPPEQQTTKLNHQLRESDHFKPPTRVASRNTQTFSTINQSHKTTIDRTKLIPLYKPTDRPTHPPTNQPTNHYMN